MRDIIFSNLVTGTQQDERLYSMKNEQEKHMTANKVYVPPIKTQGIKTKLVPLIKEHVSLSRETIWMEPFMGSGVVGFNIAPMTAVFADINPHIIEFYNQIKRGKITAYIVRNFLEEEGKICI